MFLLSYIYVFIMIPTMVHMSTTDQIMRLGFYHQSVRIGAILSIVEDHPQCASNSPDFKSSPEKGTILSENHLTAVWFPTFSNRRRIRNLGVDPHKAVVAAYAFSVLSVFHDILCSGRTCGSVHLRSLLTHED